VGQDRKAVWLNRIWQEIHTLLGSDTYFRLWLKAQETAQIPYGPIGQTIISNYASYQLAAIRRLAEIRPYVPQGQLLALRQFWDEHNESVNSWLQVPRPT
jgi:hypothetical protein